VVGKRQSDDWLPDRVYRRKDTGSYRYRPRTGGSIVIAPAGASKIEVLEAYDAYIAQDGTVDALYQEYIKSDRYQRLKPNTREDYEGAWVQLQPMFGARLVREIKPVNVRRYMDARSSKKRANTERYLLKNIFGYGVEYDWLDSNPCDNIKPFPLKARDKYVSDDEYNAMYDIVTPIMQVFMELVYICAARGQDIRMLKLDDIQDEGLLVVQQKTGKKQLKMWNERLRAAVEKALEIRAERVARCGFDSIYLLVTRNGTPYTADGLKAIWQKQKYEGMDWTFHDLKAKGISDFEGDKQEFSGHKSRLIMERYNRSPDKVEVIDFPVKK